MASRLIYVCLIFLCLAFMPTGPASAGDYTVDSSQPTAAPRFANLNALQSAHGIMNGVNSITFRNSDASLQDGIVLRDGAELTLNGDGGNWNIQAQQAVNTRFIHAGDVSQGITINWGTGFTIKGFRSVNLVTPDGGAVFVNGNLAGGIGSVTFSDNSTSDDFGGGGAVYVAGDLIGGITGSTFIGNTALEGGAVYVAGDLTGGITGSTFIGNTARGGGAVYVAGDLTGGITGSIFSDNSAVDGSGAVYVSGNLIGGITGSTFSNNIGRWDAAVSVGDLTGGIINSTFNNNTNTGVGDGGAVYVGGDLTGGIINSTFNNNTAAYSGGAVFVSRLTGGIIDSTFNNNTAAYCGGAVHASTLNGGLTGSTFSNNSASGSDSPETQSGGAVFVQYGFAGNISDTSFTNNSANYSGGAVYASDSVYLNGANAKFVGNKAIGVVGIPASGLGGAIFHDGVPISWNSNDGFETFNLTATEGDPIVFTGNTMNPGQGGAVANSIYFGNAQPSEGLDIDNGQVQATFRVEQGGALHMLDPLASQPDDMAIFPKPTTFILGNLVLSINKTGPGTWYLAGVSDMQSATNWVVSDGSLHLVADGNAAPAHIKLANTTNAMGVADPASFTLKSGAQLLLEPTTAPHQITGQKITLESGSKVGLAGFQYGPLLDKGNYTVLNLQAGGGVSNQSSVPITSGTIAVGAHDYKYKDLAWDASGQKLTMTVGEGAGSGPAINQERTGVPAITGSSNIGALNPSFNAFNTHAQSVFNNLPSIPANTPENTPGQISGLNHMAAGEAASVYLNRLWITPSYSGANQNSGGNNVGYSLSSPGFSFGYDRQISDKAFAGVGINVSWPEYKGGGTDINANDITFALYGGARLPYALELDGHIGYGFSHYDQDRQAMTERYTTKYDGNSLFVGLGLGRPFALGGGFTLRPGVAYDYIHLNTDGYNEGQGTFALNTDSYSQNLHRVKAGMEGVWQHGANGVSVTGEVYYLGLYGDRSAQASAHFINDPVNGFASIGNALDKDNLGLSLGVNLPVTERWELGAGYTVLLGSDAISQQGTLNVKFKF